MGQELLICLSLNNALLFFRPKVVTLRIIYIFQKHFFPST